MHELNDLLGSNILNRLLPLYSVNSLRWIIILKSPVQEPGAAIPTANHDKSTFASLKVSDYRYLWIGMLGSAFAMNMQLVAQGWLVYEMTSSAMNLTYVTLAFMLPQIIFSPIVVGFFNGTALAISIPARTALIPEIVGEKLMFNAMAFNTASWNLSRILGPALAGFMIAIFAEGDTTSSYGVGLVYIVLSVLYMTSAVTVAFIKHDCEPNRTNNNGPMTDLIEGMNYVKGSPIVGGLILLSIYPFLFGISINTFLPAFNTDVLNGGPDDLGFLMTAMGVGAIGGSLVLARLVSLKHKGNWTLFTSLCWGAAVAIFATTESILWSTITIGCIGFLSAINMSMNRSLVQLQVEQSMRGRVMSIDMMSHGLMPIGIIPIGYIVDNYSIQAGLVTSGVMLMLLTIISAFLMPSIRGIDTGYS